MLNLSTKSVCSECSRMVNPLLGAKMEPLASTSSHSPLSFVKLELDHSDKDEDKVEVKMEVLGELFGDNFGCVNSLLSDPDNRELLLSSDSLSFGNHSSYTTDLSDSHSILRTVKVPLHTEVGDGNFPPVLSIPASNFANLSSPTADLHISISPVSQAGADTTSLASPTRPLSTSSASSAQKKTVFTAKGMLVDRTIRSWNRAKIITGYFQISIKLHLRRFNA